MFVKFLQQYFTVYIHNIPLFFFFFFFFFFLPNNELLFLLQVNLYMITGIYLHDPSPFNGPFFMTPPFSESQKFVTLPLFPPPPLPLLISDKSLGQRSKQRARPYFRPKNFIFHTYFQTCPQAEIISSLPKLKH